MNAKAGESIRSFFQRASGKFWGLMEHRNELYSAVFLNCLVLYTLLVLYLIYRVIINSSKLSIAYFSPLQLSYFLLVLKLYILFWILLTSSNFLIKLFRKQYSDHYVALCIFFACFTYTHICRFLPGGIVFFAPIFLLSCIALCGIFLGPKFGVFTAYSSMALYVGAVALKLSGRLAPVPMVLNSISYNDFIADKINIAVFAAAFIMIMLIVGSAQTKMVKLLDRKTAELEGQNQVTRKLMADLDASYQKLQELDQLKTAFFANISHEIRTPLTMSLAPLESLLAGEKGQLKPEQADYLSVMRRNMLRLLALINNLLDFSKLDAGKMKLHVREENLGNLAKYMAGAVESWAERKGIDISCAVDSRLPAVYLDREKMEKVFLNLLSNAIKFTDSGGRIKVRVDQRDGQVEVSVTDTGIGIPPEAQGKIFDRFAQVDGNASRQYEGTGIGLALVKEFVELHGGKVGVESKLGEGSSFIFRLPLGREHFDANRVEFLDPGAEPGDSVSPKALSIMAGSEARGGPEEPAAPAVPDDDRPTVLVVEDNPDMRQFIREILSRQFTVHTARDGAEGVARARELLPSLVLSDVMMPNKDGYQLCQELKSDPKTSGVPLILVTARAELSMKLEGLQKGADDYLIKPFNAQELLCRVSNLIKLRTHEQEVLKTSLGRFLPPKIVKEMLHGSEDLLTRKKRKKLTVFFSDIRGFTALSDHMEPEETIELLNKYMQEMSSIIDQQEGTLDKFIGDGIMGFFGDPLDQSDQALRAVKMALAMQRRIAELQDDWLRASGKNLAVGIGINTGYCTVGGFGSARRLDYTAVGTPVNIAARLQALADGGEIIISSSTYNEVKDQVQAEDLGEVELKGLPYKTKIYRVKAVAS